ncbi:unnamed protein product [Pseudo-nitzschia multistriata]|uniref:Uncharacterized protein n=1 Tax=Pseudo-nitzschia multistriata TaxID=183589 RepID=A0A448ZRZ2_9STRA|nr:unnamed protein product [Pseudo-nitzschia multistriata]
MRWCREGQKERVQTSHRATKRSSCCCRGCGSGRAFPWVFGFAIAIAIALAFRGLPSSSQSPPCSASASSSSSMVFGPATTRSSSSAMVCREGFHLVLLLLLLLLLLLPKMPADARPRTPSSETGFRRPPWCSPLRKKVARSSRGILRNTETRIPPFPAPALSHSSCWSKTAIAVIFFAWRVFCLASKRDSGIESNRIESNRIECNARKGSARGWIETMVSSGLCFALRSVTDRTPSSLIGTVCWTARRTVHKMAQRMTSFVLFDSIRSC